MNWHKLRTWGGSQQGAFEELCCQLAAHEPFDESACFVRKGTPDAGVECFWREQSGSEIAWQAKFFVDGIDENQWGQVDKSVRTALTKHPDLIEYIICFPLDRPDARREDQTSLLQKWNARAEKWRGWAQAKGMNVEFVWWGRFELSERLTKEEHAGRRLFWFDEEFFSGAWYSARLAEALATAGERFSSDLNIQLPIHESFEGLARTATFSNSLRAHFGRVNRRAERLCTSIPQTETGPLRQELDSLQGIFSEVASISHELYPWDSLRAQAERCIGSAEELEATFSSPLKLASGEEAERDSQFQRHYCRELRSKLADLVHFTETQAAQAANSAFLLLTGAAGTGKTHLLCDVVGSRIHQEEPAVLLMGEWFEASDPLAQIPRLLRVKASFDEFLGALSANGEATRTRALLVIDALNEGDAKSIWRNHLDRLRAISKRFPWLAIAVSVRSTYREVVISDTLADAATSCRHGGFSGTGFETLIRFFGHYGIRAPAAPILHSEFNNPLFLKLFCQSLKNRGMDEIPLGFDGLAKTFDDFTDSVNIKLSRDLDYDPCEHPVQTAVVRLADAMAAAGASAIPRVDAKSLLEQILPGRNWSRSLYRHLLAEGLIAEELVPESHEEQVRFTFERLTDFFIARSLIENHYDDASPHSSFAPATHLGAITKDVWSLWQNRGLVEALMALLAERAGRELGVLIPHVADELPLALAFIESLTIRSATAFSAQTQTFANDHALKHHNALDSFEEALIRLACVTGHPLNADYLHKRLTSLTLADRDANWSISLHEKHGRESASDQLIRWAWEYAHNADISKDAVHLCGTALAWHLTASNRFVRDSATKALVSLFDNRLVLLAELLRRFKDVNDPYVSERLYGVAYGCATRCKDPKQVDALARTVFELIFAAQCAPPNILLRDYARGVVELAHLQGGCENLDISLARPPYRSSAPDLPTHEQVEKYSEFREGMTAGELASLSIASSTLGRLGDFGIYVLGREYGFDWSNRPLVGEKEPTPKEIVAAFVASLTDRQRNAWDRLLRVRANVAFARRLSVEQQEHYFKTQLPEAALDEANTRELKRFCKYLGRKKLAIFDKKIKQVLDRTTDDSVSSFDVESGGRWIVLRAFELGWTKDRFGEFDRYIDRVGRSAHKAERIGKKYQWIAYYELLARIADNFEFRPSDPSESAAYEGTWQLTYVRNIDPSWLPPEAGWLARSPKWQFATAYDNWALEESDDDWLRTSDDLPLPPQLIEVSHGGSDWLLMEGHYTVDQPSPPEQEKCEKPQRQLWLQLRSYLVRRKDVVALMAWAQRQNFMGRWMPESCDMYRPFWGELYWAPSCHPYKSAAEWRRTDRGGHSLPVDVCVTAEGLVHESSTYDCSINETMSVLLPSRRIVEELPLVRGQREAEFVTEDGSVAAFDPSLTGGGPSALLMRKKTLVQYLNSHDYGLVWTVLGEKHMVGAWDTHGAGVLEINGVYYLESEKVVGNLRSSFREFDKV